MCVDIDPAEELYSRYPYPPADPMGRGWRRRFQSRMEEGREIARTLLEHNQDVARGSVLDAGCGTGLKLLGLAESLPEARILGIDFSQPSLTIARRFVTEAGVKNVALGWADLSEGFPDDRADSFDAVVCDGVLHHMKRPETGLSHLVRVLREGGLAWITLFGKHGRAEMGRLRQMLNVLEPRFLYFDKRLANARSLLKATGLLSKRHARQFLEDAFLADAVLNPRETWYDLVSARRFFEGAGLTFESWVDGEKHWPALVKAMEDAGLTPEEFDRPLSTLEKMRLVELWKCPGILRFVARKPKAT